MSIRTRRIAIPTLTLALTLTTAVWPTIAGADPVVHHVYNTGGAGVWLHSTPTIQDGLLTVLPEAAEFDPQCWTESEAVNGNPLWLFGSSGSATGYVTDFYVDTHWNITDDLTAQGIPSCDEQASSPAAPTFNPVSVQLKPNAGEREYGIAGLTESLQAAASRANVDGQTLAHIIYHEGENYLSVRRSATELKEMLVTSSVGIAQVKVDTARLVDLKVYQDWALVMEPDDIVIRSKLIYDWGYALRTAAGYVRLLQDEGVTGDFPQFMSYALSLDAARAWKDTGYSMEVPTLESLGISSDVFKQRQDKFNEARDAIG
jgi:hypothetical protein